MKLRMALLLTVTPLLAFAGNVPAPVYNLTATAHYWMPHYDYTVSVDGEETGCSFTETSAVCGSLQGALFATLADGREIVLGKYAHVLRFGKYTKGDYDTDALVASPTLGKFADSGGDPMPFQYRLITVTSNVEGLKVGTEYVCVESPRGFKLGQWEEYCYDLKAFVIPKPKK